MSAPEPFATMLAELNRVFAEMPPLDEPSKYLARMLSDPDVAPAWKYPWSSDEDSC